MQIGVGLGITNTGVLGVVGEIVNQITATTAPAFGLLYDGQSLANTPWFTGMTTVGNFTSSEGTIISAVVAASRDGVGGYDENTVWATGDFISYTVTVTDSLGTVEVFDAGEYEVVYRATSSVDVATNTFTVEFNPDVPDTETTELVVSGLGAMNGTYDVLKADTLLTIPFVLDGSINPDYTGDLGDLEPLDVIALNSGLWFAPSGSTITFTKRALVDGVAVGAAGDTYTLQSADMGKPFAIEVTANDGTNTVIEVGNAILLPAAIDLMSDTFTAANGTLLSAHTENTWLPWAEGFPATSEIQSNALEFAGSGNGETIVSGVSLLNGDIVGTINTGDKTGNRLGLIARGSDVSGNYSGYQAYVDADSNLVIIRKRTGSLLGIATIGGTQAYAFAADTDYEVTFRLSGSTLQILIDGTLVHTATDGDISTAGYIGICQNSNTTMTMKNIVARSA